MTLPAPLSPRSPWHALPAAEVERALATGPHGLPPAEARARLDRYGQNQLAEVPGPSAIAILLHQFASPLIYLLVLAAGVSLAIGELVDAAVIGIVLLANALIGFVQERRAEMSVRALMRLAAPHARVLRGGREWDVESRDLVPGDLVLLESGTLVPADLRLTGATALLVDESLLTGESEAIPKQTDALPADAATADRVNLAYAGTVVRSGRGRGHVIAVGAATELGSIAEHMRRENRGPTPLQLRMAQFGRVVGITVAIGAALAFAIGTVAGRGMGDMFLVAVALAVSAVPEGLPVAFTITLARGVRRMARRNAIVRRLGSVEVLGSTTVIGADKTGTLTQNRMTVQQAWAGGRRWGMDGTVPAIPGSELATTSAVAEHRALYLTILAGVLANEAELYRTESGSTESAGDPTETALLDAAARLGIEPADVRGSHPCEAALPFEPELQYSASVCRLDGEPALFIKGAPERVLSMCDRMLTATPAPLDAGQVLAVTHQMASHGLRVLALAYRPLTPDHRGPAALHDPRELVFLGLQGMRDPPRAGVREAVAGCRAAGIRVLMITGDHAATGRAIGIELGITGPDEPLLTGVDLDALSDSELRDRVGRVAVYARVSPEHKLRIVHALRARGEVVALTGDGVNDAPALRAAQVGVAMGRDGTDVAREAADIVLADDNFVSVYGAVEEGRVTFDNIRKVTFFLISTNMAEVIAILGALLLGWPLPLLAVQLLWLNLVTEGLQGVALAFEPGEPGVLERPPRRPHEGIINGLLWERTVIAGVVQAAGALGLFAWELSQSGSLVQAQTAALTTLVAFQMLHVGNSRSEHQSVFRMSPFSNRFLFVGTAAALAVHLVALYLPVTQLALGVAPLDGAAWLRIAAVSSSIIVAMELHKMIRRRTVAP